MENPRRLGLLSIIFSIVSLILTLIYWLLHSDLSLVFSATCVLISLIAFGFSRINANLPIIFFNFFRLDVRGDRFIDNRWEKVCLGLICTLVAFLLLVISVYFENILSGQFFPPDFQPLALRRRLVWCLGWSLLGFAVVAFSDSRRPWGEEVRSPFPSYFYFYPCFLIVNSLAVFGFLNIYERTWKIWFYPISAWLCMNLGFWIDVINFKELFNYIIKSFKKK